MEFKEAKAKINTILFEMNKINLEEVAVLECHLNEVYTYFFCNEEIAQLQNTRNKLNRQIATLKKANLN